MAGVGLSGNALEGWLEEWMKLISADVCEMAQGGIGSTIPGSRAAELLVERRLATAVAAIAGKCRLLHMATMAVHVTCIVTGPAVILQLPTALFIERTHLQTSTSVYSPAFVGSGLALTN